MSPGGPLLKGELMVRRVLEGLKQISDSGLLGCLSIWPRYWILRSEAWEQRKETSELELEEEELGAMYEPNIWHWEEEEEGWIGQRVGVQAKEGSTIGAVAGGAWSNWNR